MKDGSLICSICQSILPVVHVCKKCNKIVAFFCADSKNFCWQLPPTSFRERIRWLCNTCRPRLSWYDVVEVDHTPLVIDVLELYSGKNLTYDIAEMFFEVYAVLAHIENEEEYNVHFSWMKAAVKRIRKALRRTYNETEDDDDDDNDNDDELLPPYGSYEPSSYRTETQFYMEMDDESENAKKKNNPKDTKEANENESSTSTSQLPTSDLPSTSYVYVTRELETERTSKIPILPPLDEPDPIQIARAQEANAARALQMLKFQNFSKTCIPQLPSLSFCDEPSTSKNTVVRDLDTESTSQTPERSPLHEPNASQIDRARDLEAARALQMLTLSPLHEPNTSKLSVEEVLEGLSTSEPQVEEDFDNRKASVEHTSDQSNTSTTYVVIDLDKACTSKVPVEKTLDKPNTSQVRKAKHSPLDSATSSPIPANSPVLKIRQCGKIDEPTGETKGTPKIPSPPKVPPPITRTMSKPKKIISTKPVVEHQRHGISLTPLIGRDSQQYKSDWKIQIEFSRTLFEKQKYGCTTTPLRLEKNLNMSIKAQGSGELEGKQLGKIITNAQKEFEEIVLDSDVEPPSERKFDDTPM